MNMLMPTSTVQERQGLAGEIRLDAGSVRSVHVEPGSVVTVLAGLVWLTAQGDGEDYILSAGEQFTANRSGRVVVEPMRGRAALSLL